MEIFALLGVFFVMCTFYGFLTEVRGILVGRLIRIFSKLMLRFIVKTLSALYTSIRNKSNGSSPAKYANAQLDTGFASFSGKTGRDLVVPTQANLNRAPGLVYDEQRKLFVKTKTLSKH